MSDSNTDRFKFGLLKVIDISGFKVFDPVIRLLFREEPRKQLGDIGRFLVTPIIFVVLCLVLWTFIAPRHKTKSGEVPTPAEVWGAAVTNDTLNERENEKDHDFLLSGDERLAMITEVQSLLEQKKTESARLADELQSVEQNARTAIEEQLAPLETRYDELKAANKTAQSSRDAEITSVAEAIISGTRTKADLLDAVRTDNVLTDSEKEAEREVKDLIKEVENNPPKELKRAQLASSAAANEVQHLQKRLDYLQTGNRSVKEREATEKTYAASEKLDTATTPAALITAAKSVVRSEESMQKISEQQYPRTATIWFQVQRSLFTVFVGFVLAAAIAIPLGIMCGLNKVVMACLTPIISVFKPVSPVVWLLIFQIVVGAFFPDPENHSLFVFFGSLPFIGDLGVNPALVFSACTVAMCALWPALVNTALGVSSIDKDHLNVAKVLRLGLWSRLFKIIIPSALPLVFAGLRISLGVGWMVLIAAEALSSSEGLGKFVWDEYQNGSSHSFANIIFACFVIGFIGFFLDRIMILMQRSVSFDDGAAVV